MKIEPKTLKGFRDFLPAESRKRAFALNTLKKVFESYGFEPLETPVLEYEDILLGKYGDEGDKLMYRFEDNGKRRVAMRYDQTVPLARVVAQYANDLPLPFKRYQIQNVYRADNTQKGRYREFLQVDVDSVGASSPLSDAEIIALVIES
jgi:histidyl-tRNA synthetase